MALLHGSRVMAAMDRKLASEFYAEGVAAAALLRRLPKQDHPRAFAGTELVESFAQSGDFDIRSNRAAPGDVCGPGALASPSGRTGTPSIVLGLAAEALLTEIPDPDLALLASIEMAAGILGLPEYNGVRMEQHLKR
jgi:hypothetical protein